MFRLFQAYSVTPLRFDRIAWRLFRLKFQNLETTGFLVRFFIVRLKDHLDEPMLQPGTEVGQDVIDLLEKDEQEARRTWLRLEEREGA